MNFKTTITFLSNIYKLSETLGLERYLPVDNFIFESFEEELLKFQAYFRNAKVAICASNGKRSVLDFFNNILSNNNNTFITNLSKKAGLYSPIVSIMRSLPPDFSRRDYYSMACCEDNIEECFSLVKFNCLLLHNVFLGADNTETLVEKRKKIQRTILLNPNTALIINADDPLFYEIDNNKSQNKLFYGFSKVEYHLSESELSQKNDFLTCPKCEDILEYKERFYSHLGHYNCICGFRRPNLDIAAEAKIYNNYSILNINYKENTYSFKVPQGGLYNAYNALGAIALALYFNIERKVITSAFESYTPLRAHDDIVCFKDKKAKVKIIKNSASLTEAMQELYNQKSAKIVFCFSDIGFKTTDTSWIWDANFEVLKDFFQGKIYITSNRFDDMALRLKYAGVNPCSIVMDSCVKNAIKACYWELEEDETMYVFSVPSLVDEVYKVFLSCNNSKNKLQ